MATLVDTYLPLTNKLVDEGQGLSAVQVGNKKYAVRDANSRAAIAAALSAIDTLSSAVQGGVHYIGKTTSELSDGATTNPIIIGGESVTAKQGDMVSMEKSGSQDLEFIFNGTTWYELGSTGTLKSLAFKDSASGDFAATLTAFSGTAQTAGALTVDFTEATFSGDTNTICAEFTGSGITPSGTFSGEQATLTAAVVTKNTELTVPFSGVSVNVITSISTDAIKAPPALSVSTVQNPSIDVTGSTETFTRLTAATTSSLAVGTGFSGSSTTFSGTYTPEGEVSGYVGSVITSVGFGEAKPTGTVTKPGMSSGTGSYFNSATVTDEVLSFGSADAISAVSLTSNPEFSGTGFSGSLTSGTGNKAVTAEFKGSGKTVSVSGTPLGELTKTTIDYVKSASSADTAVTVSASGQLTATLLTGVKYSGSGAAASITSGKGDIAAAGSTTVTYAEPLSVSIGYKPSGTISIDSITPTGTVAGTVKPTGSITGTQTVAGHTHDVSGSGTASGSVTVS